MRLTDLSHPLDITMWDFSWLERRWTGGGYSDWGRALDGLRERGYDAIRIDAYPHLLAADPDREWDLVPVWSEHDWGAPAPVRIPAVRAALIEFITACRDRGLLVALSSWYREDTTDARMRYDTPAKQAASWTAVLDTIVDAGLGDQVLYVDLANEFPVPLFNPYAYPEGTAAEILPRGAPPLRNWMADAIGAVREKHPDFDYCFSFATELTPSDQDVAAFDLLELHIWMTNPEISDFYRSIGYNLYTSHNDPASYVVLQRAEAEYRRSPAHWHERLVEAVEAAADWSRASGKPLVSTECWAIVNYKDWPSLDWGWVKELTEFGVRASARTGRWAAIASSNFCGPQFHGMWQDVQWHRRVTDAIHAGTLPTTP